MILFSEAPTWWETGRLMKLFAAIRMSRGNTRGTPFAASERCFLNLLDDDRHSRRTNAAGNMVRRVAVIQGRPGNDKAR